MKNFLEHIKKLSSLKDEEIPSLKDITRVRSYEKGSKIVKMSEINRKLYFIDEGMLKVSFFKDDREFVMNFFSQHEFCAVLDSLVNDQPSNYVITAIANVSLTEIDYPKLNKLAARYQSFEQINSRLTAMATGHMMNRIRELLEADATERYRNFIEKKGHLLNLISLKDLAGYLGISQVSLSRIRAKK